MKIIIPKEIKNNEYRVGLTPSSVKQLSDEGHEIFVENNAGVGIGYSNNDYELSGASVIDDRSDLFKKGELIIKVKEPIPEEFQYLNSSHTLFTYLHTLQQICPRLLVPGQRTCSNRSKSNCL